MFDVRTRSLRPFSLRLPRGAGAFTVLALAATANAQVCPTASPNWPGPAGYPYSASIPGDEVASIGDVDGDLITDLVVSNHDGSNWVAVVSGRAYYHFDSTFYPPTLVGELSPIWADVALASDGVDFGWEVQPAGDLNGDGVQELIVGVPGIRDTTPLHDGKAILYTSVVTTGSLPGWIRAIEFTGPNCGCSSPIPSSGFGWCAAAAGDVDGDSVDDVVVGAPRANGGTGGQGEAYLFSGAALNTALAATTTRPITIAHTSGTALTPHATSTNPLTPSVAGSSFGVVVMGVGDVDADGRDDVIVGAPTASGKQTNAATGLIDSIPRAGATFLFARHSGNSTPSLLVADQGACSYDYFGYEASAVGDVAPQTGAAQNEYAIGAIQQDLATTATGQSGGYLQVRAFVAPASSSLVYEKHNPASSSPASNCAPATHTYGYVRFGAYLAGDPDNDGDSRDSDFDGDGLGEVVHGDYFHVGAEGEVDAGASWVYSSDASTHATLPTDDCWAQAALALGQDPPTAFGASASLALGEATALLPMASDPSNPWTEDVPRYAVSANVASDFSGRQIQVHTLYGPALVETSSDTDPQPTIRWLSDGGSSATARWVDGGIEFSADDPSHGAILAISTELANIDYGGGVHGPLDFNGTTFYAWTGTTYPTTADLTTPPLGMIAFTYVAPGSYPGWLPISLSAADHPGTYAGQQVFAQLIEFDLSAPAASARVSDLLMLRLAP
ncbi:MAG: FG-GAP repeat protein [Planctomycetes bacterium]|nr:FG-GAP repeat protein [Planctomycetota bacterium]